MSSLKKKINERKSYVTYDIRVISTNQYVEMRPYTVGEEKQYMIAESSKDIRVLFNTLKNIIANCSFDAINPETLTDADIQFIMLQLKAKSKDNKVLLKLTCPNCHKSFNYNADLEKVNYESDQEHNYEFALQDMVFYMQDPTLESIAKMTQTSDSTISEKIDAFIEILSDCIVRVAFDDEIVDFTLETKEDKMEFLYSLDSNEVEKLKTFFDTLPQFAYEINCSCPHCKKQIQKTIKGIDGFFFS